MEFINLIAVLNVNPEHGINFMIFLVTSSGLLISVVQYNKKQYGDKIKNLQDKIDCKAEKTYVDQQDRSIHKRIDEMRQDNKDEHGELRKMIRAGFNDIKDLIEANHKRG